jgi:preprotein translocase subunit Sec61beta
MATRRTFMPSSGGGIIRYGDGYKSKLSIKPGYLVVLIVIIVTVILIFQMYGAKLLGLI